MIDGMQAAPVEIVKVETKAGAKTSEFWGGVVAADVLAVLGTVGDWLPIAWRWVPMAGTLLVKAAYVIARGVAKRPAAVPAQR